MNSKLVPVIRKDKNGKSTTRWVKDVSAAASDLPTRTIPAPQSAPVAKTPMLDAVMYDQPHDIKRTTAELLEAELQRSASDNRRVAALAGSISLVAPKESPTDINNLALFYRQFDSDSMATIWEHVEGLRCYKELEGIEDFSTGASPRQQEQARALIYAASRLDESWVELLGGDDDGEYPEYEDDDDYEDGNFSYPEDRDDHKEKTYDPSRCVIYLPSLVSLLMQHPDKAEQVVDLINREGLRDVELIRNRFLHPEPALSSGVL